MEILYENMTSLHWLFTNEEAALMFAFQNGVIYNQMICPNCNKSMHFYLDQSKSFGCKWVCPCCKKTKSLLYGSIFYSAKIPICKIFHLLYCWAYQYSCQDTAREVGVNSSTVTFYFTLFRLACDSYVVSLGGIIVGGEGKTVQIDETLMCRRKYHVGRELNQIWIFGGICVEDRQFFCVVVPDRQKDTLEEEITKHILPGTTIISDCWKSYNYLDSVDEYDHKSVNHSENFVDPVTKVNTQMIERLWRELKKINKKYEGIPEHKVNEHISEFLWRNSAIIDKNRKFEAAVKLIADTKFITMKDDFSNIENEEEEDFQ